MGRFSPLSSTLHRWIKIAREASKVSLAALDPQRVNRKSSVFSWIWRIKVESYRPLVCKGQAEIVSPEPLRPCSWYAFFLSLQRSKNIRSNNRDKAGEKNHCNQVCWALGLIIITKVKWLPNYEGVWLLKPCFRDRDAILLWEDCESKVPQSSSFSG